MALSEIRVNTTKTRTGVGTITYTETGPVITGIATASNFKTGSTNVHSTGVELTNINTGGATATFGGAISGTSATLSGALSGATASFSGNVSIGGTLTYEDVTNIDSVGVVTARDGVHITGDNKYLKIGAGNDLGFVHTGSETFITNLTGHLTHRSDVHKWENYAGNKEYIRIISDGKIGINSTSPTYGMHLHGTGASNNAYYYAEQSSAGASAGFRLKTTGSHFAMYGAVSGSALGIYDYNAGAERFTIDSAGRVGVGTFTPHSSYRFDIRHTSDSILHLGQNNNTLAGMGNNSWNALSFQGTNCELGLYKDSSGNFSYIMGTYQGSTAIPLVFRTGNRAERLRIHADGEVEIKPSVAGQTTLSVQALWANASRVHIATFGRNGNDVKSAITYNHGTNRIEFGTTTNHSIGLTSNNVERIQIKSNGQIGVNMAPSADAQFCIKNSDDSNYNVFDCYNDNGNKMGGFSQNSSGDGTVAVRKNDGTLNAMLRSNGDSYVKGGRFFVGTDTQSISSSEIFEVKSAAHGFSYFENNSSSGYAPIYINAKYSNTAFAPLITVTDGGGNRAGLGLDSSEQLRVHGQGGVEIYTGGTMGGGTQKWRINNLGDLTHTFAGRHGNMIGSTDGSGAYLMLDGAEGNPLSSGTDYMYMEHTSSGNFDMWNGNGSVSTTKFMEVSPAGYIRNPKQPSFAAYRTQSAWSVGSGDEMVFNGTRHNVGSHYSTSNGRFTAPVAGSYLFTFFSIHNTNVNSGYIRMFKNGARIYGSDIHFTYDQSSHWDNVSYSQIIYLSANDYVSIYNGNPGVNYHGNHWQQFCGYLLG